MHRNGSNENAKRGITLTEVVISSGLVGVLIVAALQATGAVVRARIETSQISDSHALAMDLMAEIQQTAYEDPDGGTQFGTESGESSSTRNDFDDVDDFEGWSATPPQHTDGTAISNAYTRSVAVSRVSVTDPSAAITSDDGLKRIVVTVTSPGGHTVTLTRLRSSAGMLELKPPVDRTYVTRSMQSLHRGGTTTTRTLGSSVSNHAEDD